MIRTKIGVLKEKLRHVTGHWARVRSRTGERGVLKVALVGYTNAGCPADNWGVSGDPQDPASRGY
jgi:50S ribosomal subunit-associated GTPase HflX